MVVVPVQGTVSAGVGKLEVSLVTADILSSFGAKAELADST
jgi:hypothetical protein